MPDRSSQQANRARKPGSQLRLAFRTAPPVTLNASSGPVARKTDGPSLGPESVPLAAGAVIDGGTIGTARAKPVSNICGCLATSEEQ